MPAQPKLTKSQRPSFMTKRTYTDTQTHTQKKKKKEEEEEKAYAQRAHDTIFVTKRTYIYKMYHEYEYATLFPLQKGTQLYRKYAT